MAEQSVTVEALVQEAVLRSLTTEVRDKLIGEAIASIMKENPSRSGFGTGEPSDLSVAFKDACRDEVRKYAKQVLEDSEPMKAKLREIVDVALAKFMDSFTVETVGVEIANTLSELITKNMRGY